MLATATIACDSSVLRGMEQEAEELNLHLEFYAEILQGPCVGNQNFLALSTVMPETLKRILISKIHKPGQNETKTVGMVRAACCKIFAAMLEGGDDLNVMGVIVDVLDSESIRIIIREVYTRCQEIETDKKTPMAKNPELAAEYDALLSCGYDIMSVLMQIKDLCLERGIVVEPTNAELEEKGNKFAAGWKWINSKVKRLEFEWLGGLDITYFAVVKEAAALTEASKMRVKGAVTIESPDAKKRDFMNKGQELVDEMNWLYKLAKIPIILLIRDYYLPLRMGAFAIAVMLNIMLLISVKGPGNDGGIGQYNTYDYGLISVKPENAEKAVLVLTFAAMGCYAACLFYTLCARVPLVYSARKREQEQLLALHRKELDKPDAKLPFGEFVKLYAWFGAVVVYAFIGLIFWYKYNLGMDCGWDERCSFFAPEYWRFGAIIFGVILVPLLNDFWDGSDNIFAYNYVSMYRALTEKETLAIIVFQVFNVLGIKRFYFSTLLLLDFVTLSDRLQNVARAVITPIMDLILVFTLMIFVAFIFASYGMFFFGQYYVLPSDDMTIRTDDDERPAFIDPLFGPATLGADESYPTGMAGNGREFNVGAGDPTSTCPNLAMCFFETLDVGMRTGDIVGNAMDSVWYDGGLTYADRVFFGIVFFFLLGVILFDIVTGIIIDTFSSLREDTKNRMEYMLNTAFISDLDRAEYEELGPEFKFEKLQNIEQDMWNYVLFMAHLRAKPSDSYSGAESEIARQIAAQDPSWFPDKKSFQQQKFLEGTEEDASDVLDDRIIEIRAEVDATKTLSSNAAGAPASSF